MYSNVTHMDYDPAEMIYIKGTRQSGLYIANGCTLYDIIWSDRELIFVFNRKESKLYFDLWCKYELPEKNSENASYINEIRKNGKKKTL